jgi:hypothetical protein
MRRRDFIRAVYGAALVWPIVGRAQQPVMPVVAVLSALPQEFSTHLIAAWRKASPRPASLKAATWRSSTVLSPAGNTRAFRDWRLSSSSSRSDSSSRWVRRQRSPQKSRRLVFDCLRSRARSGCGGSSCELESAWWKCHWHESGHRPARPEAARNSA